MTDREHEPFSQTWLGIAMQVFVVIVLILLLIERWNR
jgi:hypothetical protein